MCGKDSILQNIKTLVLDVDGVLTDGRIILLPDGIQARSMNVKDGYAMKKLLHSGLDIIVITGGNSEEVRYRLEMLGVRYIYSNISDKLTCLKEIIADSDRTAEEMAFMGDDIPDMACMQYVSVSACPRDAVDEVKNISQYICHKKGGDGCVREFIEMILKTQGKWEDDFHIKSA